MTEPKMDIFERHPQPVDTLTADSAATDAELTQAKEDLMPSAGIVLQDHNPRAAFEKFAGRVYETGSIDYTGSANPISVARLRETLASAQHDLLSSRGTNAHRGPEPPVTRFARLKSELADLRVELELLAEQDQQSKSVGTQPSADGNGVAAIAVALTGELDSMASELEGVASQSEFAPFVIRASGASDGVKRRQIAEAVKSAFSAAEQPPSASAAAAPQQQTSGTAAAVRAASSFMRTDEVHTADLERRVAQLETVLGSTSLSPYPDVHTALAHLEDRLDLLSPAALDQIKARVDNVNQELEKLAKKSDSVLGKQADRIDKVSKLYDTMQRWDAAAHQLPIVIARLESQRELNQANAGAAARLKRLEDAHGTITETLRKDRELLEQMQSNLRTAAEQMKTNVKEMDSRVKRIEKKAKKLGI